MRFQPFQVRFLGAFSAGLTIVLVTLTIAPTLMEEEPRYISRITISGSDMCDNMCFSLDNFLRAAQFSKFYRITSCLVNFMGR